MRITDIHQDNLSCRFLFIAKFKNNLFSFPQPNTYQNLKYNSTFNISSHNWDNNHNEKYFLKTNEPFFERMKDLWIINTKEGKEVQKILSARLEERGPSNP